MLCACIYIYIYIVCNLFSQPSTIPVRCKAFSSFPQSLKVRNTHYHISQFTCLIKCLTCIQYFICMYLCIHTQVCILTSLFFLFVLLLHLLLLAFVIILTLPYIGTCCSSLTCQQVNALKGNHLDRERINVDIYLLDRDR